jgi:hypothetical protein
LACAGETRGADVFPPSSSSPSPLRYRTHNRRHPSLSPVIIFVGRCQERKKKEPHTKTCEENLRVIFLVLPEIFQVYPNNRHFTNILKNIVQFFPLSNSSR